MCEVIVDQVSRQAELLAAALAETAAELRLIEARDIAAFMRTGRWANIADLIQSSAELSLVEGSLIFACVGEGAIRDAKPASVRLDMEFQHGPVTAFFTLALEPNDTRVEIRKLWFSSAPADAATQTRLFEQALAAARIEPAKLR